jgi:hypothetical protein
MSVQAVGGGTSVPGVILVKVRVFEFCDTHTHTHTHTHTDRQTDTDTQTIDTTERHWAQGDSGVMNQKIYRQVASSCLL